VTDLMSPMDSYAWFDNTRVTYVNTPAAAEQFLAIEPRRVGLIIHANGQMTISPDPDLATGPGTGITVNNTFPPFMITQDQYGPLVQGAWYCLGSISASMVVIEVLLREWPGDVPQRG
jgi:hypothetical protein